MVIFMLTVGKRFLDSAGYPRHWWLENGQEAVMPLYLLHQPVIIPIAFHVVQWQTGILVKRLIIVPSSFAVTSNDQRPELCHNQVSHSHSAGLYGHPSASL